MLSKSDLEDEKAVWTALAILLIGDYPTLGAAMTALEDRARDFGVPAAHIAAYVLRRGALPS